MRRKGAVSVGWAHDAAYSIYVFLHVIENQAGRIPFRASRKIPNFLTR
jgi:hypothetical protein